MGKAGWWISDRDWEDNPVCIIKIIEDKISICDWYGSYIIPVNDSTLGNELEKAIAEHLDDRKRMLTNTQANAQDYFKTQNRAYRDLFCN